MGGGEGRQGGRHQKQMTVEDSRRNMADGREQSLERQTLGKAKHLSSRKKNVHKK